jgi:NAD dependent epimerase/dehydratase family enzyme
LKQILIAGGSGLVGTSLTRRLKAKGYKVAFLGRKSRKRVKGVDKYTWDVHSGYIDPIAFENTEVVINLSGAGVADKRWNNKRKKRFTIAASKVLNYLTKEFRNTAKRSIQ